MKHKSKKHVVHNLYDSFFDNTVVNIQLELQKIIDSVDIEHKYKLRMSPPTVKMYDDREMESFHIEVYYESPMTKEEIEQELDFEILFQKQNLENLKAKIKNAQAHILNLEKLREGIINGTE